LSQEFLTIIIVVLTALVLGAVITYLILKALMVNRTVYDELKDKLAITKNELDTKKALEQTLQIEVNKLNKNLLNEHNLNTQQQNQLATLKAKLDSLYERANEEKVINQKQQENIEKSNNQILLLKAELSKVETIKISLEEKINDQTKEFEASRKKSLIEFENIANRLFEEKTTKFSKESTINIEKLLSPLKENLSDFKKKVEETYDKEAKQRFSLESKIKDLVTLNQQISKDATNLTNALKGQAKTQGDWGEMILENILEYSGLVKNREYFLQEHYVDEAGKKKQPDVKIKYPDDRYIIVDAKVSLTAYERFANCENLEEQKLHLAEHIKSIKNHIDNLSLKEYEKFDKTLDFVMLFVPIEPAFMTALQYDPQLWNYAYKKRVLLISPTNLIAALKMVNDIWKREQQNTNALEIAKRGEILFEKFVGFVADMDDIDKHLAKATEKYDDAMKKLSSGSGNLIGQAEKLKRLGINSKKELPEKYLIDNKVLEAENKAIKKLNNKG